MLVLGFVMFDIMIAANSQTKADTLSGGDRIFIECARRWAQKGHCISLITCREGYEMCQRYDLKNANYYMASPRRILPLYLLYILRVIKGCILAFGMKLDARNTVVYSSSDFWPDSVPSWVLKIRFKTIKWVAGFYLFAPSPFGKDSPYRGKLSFRGFLYYFTQIPIYSLIKRYADMVFVTGELDRGRFIDNRRLTPDKVIAVRGGVDFNAASKIPLPEKEQFDAVFIGRFHPQKGVPELLDIWKYVCMTKRDAKLAMIGVGELESEVRVKIKRLGLGNNVVLFGFKDGAEKLKIFKASKVVVHPAIYDSGGMAACEAMACGLPGVSFDLPALRSYYPQGMLKTPCYDLKKFADNILSLLYDEGLYMKTGEEALSWAKEWDWDKKAEELLMKITK